MTTTGTSARTCVCGHDHLAHEHYRAGSDCAICGVLQCPRFRSRRDLLRRLIKVFRGRR